MSESELTPHALNATPINFYEPSPAWRWHGLGMLQREISDEIRVHVWHPDLVKVPPGLRRVHDHRFDLYSLVLIGHLIDISYDVKIGPPAVVARTNTKAWWIKHAKIQRAGQPHMSKLGTHPTTPGDDSDVELIGDARAELRATESRRAGELYAIARGEFHESLPTGLAITLVRRVNFAEGTSARVLGDRAHSAIAGQHRTIERDDAVVSRVLGIARDRLRDAT